MAQLGGMGEQDIARLGISVREDDFSVQVSSTEDRFAWVRIETPISDPVRVTDANPGELWPEDYGVLLDIALRRAGAPQACHAFVAVTPRTRHRVRQSLEALALRRGVFLASMTEVRPDQIMVVYS